MSFGRPRIEAAPDDPVPEPEDATNRRRAFFIRRRRARGGRSSTVSPERQTDASPVTGGLTGGAIRNVFNSPRSGGSGVFR